MRIRLLLALPLAFLGACEFPQPGTRYIYPAPGYNTSYAPAYGGYYVAPNYYPNTVYGPGLGQGGSISFPPGGAINQTVVNNSNVAPAEHHHNDRDRYRHRDSGLHTSGSGVFYRGGSSNGAFNRGYSSLPNGNPDGAFNRWRR